MRLPPVCVSRSLGSFQWLMHVTKIFPELLALIDLPNFQIYQLRIHGLFCHHNVPRQYTRQQLERL